MIRHGTPGPQHFDDTVKEEPETCVAIREKQAAMVEERGLVEGTLNVYGLGFFRANVRVTWSSDSWLGRVRIVQASPITASRNPR